MEDSKEIKILNFYRELTRVKKNLLTHTFAEKFYEKMSRNQVKLDRTRKS